MRDVVINQEAQEQLALRKGISSLVIPSVFDFDNAPDPADEYASDAARSSVLPKMISLSFNPPASFREKG